MENALCDRDYVRTIQLAFELRMPHKLFTLFSDLCRQALTLSYPWFSHRSMAHFIVFRERLTVDPAEEVIRSLGKDELRVLLEFIREWNTRSHSCHVAQFVLFRIFKVFPPIEIIQVKGVRELLEGLIPYSLRHFSRIDRLARSAFLFDYTLTRMAALEPQDDLEMDSRDDAVQGEVQLRKRKSGKLKKSSGKKTKVDLPAHEISVLG